MLKQTCLSAGKRIIDGGRHIASMWKTEVEYVSVEFPKVKLTMRRL